MSHDLHRLQVFIREGVGSLTRTEAFSAWLESKKTSDGDLVVFNNSFILRDEIRTVKNGQYLALPISSGEADLDGIGVVTFEMNSDYKIVNKKSTNVPILRSLEGALETEIANLGSLLFVLIGDLRAVSCQVPETKIANVDKLIYDPQLGETAKLQENSSGSYDLILSELADPEKVWMAIGQKLSEVAKDNNIDRLEARFADAFNQLKKEARMSLHLPGSGQKKSQNTFMARIRQSLDEQLTAYAEALERHSVSNDGPSLRELMRISYNFAEDALTILNLLVSIADLKAIVLWCTLKEHYDVALSLRNLPWTKGKNKPTLPNYRKMVNGARNRAFHNLLNFDRTIEADLTNVAISARKLTLLPPFGSKNTLTLDYEDRELVEILKRLTRATEVPVPVDFWEKNRLVMQAFRDLLVKTEDVLWTLNSVR
ncbi:MAG: hypothetical protein Kow0077_28900 [Anaerolineae bacterium]